MHALQQLADMRGSKWKVDSAAVGVAGAAAVGAAGAAAVGANYLLLDEIHGVDRLRSWIQANRKISNVVGSRVWTPTERIL